MNEVKKHQINEIKVPFERIICDSARDEPIFISISEIRLQSPCFISILHF